MVKMVIKIKFFTLSGDLFCVHKFDGSLPAAISYVERLKKSFVISSVRLTFPDVIFVTMGGAA